MVISFQRSALFSLLFPAAPVSPTISRHPRLTSSLDPWPNIWIWSPGRHIGCLLLFRDGFNAQINYMVQLQLGFKKTPSLPILWYWCILICSTMMLTVIRRLLNWSAFIDIVVSWDIWYLFILWFSPAWTFACQITVSPLIPLSLQRSVNYYCWRWTSRGQRTFHGLD